MMLIDIIFIWTGRIFIFTIAWAIICFCLIYSFEKLAQINVYFKALIYHIISKKKFADKVRDKVDIRVGREWMTKYKGKWITWKITKIED